MKRSLEFDTIMEEPVIGVQDTPPPPSKKRLSLKLKKKVSTPASTCMNEQADSVLDEMCTDEVREVSLHSESVPGELGTKEEKVNLDVSQSGENFINISSPMENEPVQGSSKRKRLSLKLPKKKTSGIYYSELNLIINESCNTKYCKKCVGLTIEDKYILSGCDWLNDRHMNAANSILKKQFLGINGLKETIIVPHYSDSQN